MPPASAARLTACEKDAQQPVTQELSSFCWCSRAATGQCAQPCWTTRGVTAPMLAGRLGGGLCSRAAKASTGRAWPFSRAQLRPQPAALKRPPSSRRVKPLCEDAAALALPPLTPSHSRYSALGAWSLQGSRTGVWQHNMGQLLLAARVPGDVHMERALDWPARCGQCTHYCCCWQLPLE